MPANDKLTPQRLEEGVAFLAHRDPDLGRVVASLGSPPLWERPPGFPTLINIILEQQVSLASAWAVYSRLLEAAGTLTPERFLAFSADELRAFGFSRQKTGYCQGLACAVLDGELDLDALKHVEDEDVRLRLVAVKGIGEWTANIYLLMALLRPDVWPAGDLALAAAVQQVKNIPVRPDRNSLEALAEDWRPWRSVAARILWQQYLS